MRLRPPEAFTLGPARTSDVTTNVSMHKRPAFESALEARRQIVGITRETTFVAFDWVMRLPRRYICP